MKKLKYIFFFFAFIFSFLILFISLQSANQKILSTDSFLKERKFYFEKEILPDHSFYPVLMIFDRLRLGVAEPEKKIYLQSSYANRRFFYAARLLEKGESCFSSTTFTKAQKYLNQSLAGAINLLEESDDYSLAQRQELAFFVLENLFSCSKILNDKKDELINEDRSAIDSLESETLILQKRLESKLFDL